MPGYPDWQKIQQWLGTPVVTNIGRAIPVAPITDGPFNLASWASVVVAIKPTGGNVTVTVNQAIQGAPASLVDQGQVVAPAGQVTFASFVLFGDAVSLTLQGAGAGVTADYTLYPSNTTTNAKLLASAVTAYQKNGVLVASESVLDLIEGVGVRLTLADDPTNTRMHVTIAAPAIADVAISSGTVASIDIQNIPQTWAHLRAAIAARTDIAGSQDSLYVRMNANATAVYYAEYIAAQGTTAPSAGELIGALAAYLGTCNGGGAASGRPSAHEALIAYPEETGDPVSYVFKSCAMGGNVSGLGVVVIGGGVYNVATAPVTRLTFVGNAGNFVSGTRVTLEGVPTT